MPNSTAARFKLTHYLIGWRSEDPLGFDAGDPKLYRYVGNSPLNYTDPTHSRSLPPSPS